jgi:chromosome partitioning protein
MVICIVNQKGGVGKTTIAINLSHAMAGKRTPVRLIDGDPQASATRWKAIADNNHFDVIHHPEPLHTAIEKLTRGFTHTVIDAPPGISDITLSCLLSADIAIVPITPSPLDIWASNDIVPLIKEAKEYNKALDARILISRKVANTIVGREARQALEYYRVPVLRAEISHRIAYVNALINGETVLSYAPMSAASKEIQSLKKEIFKRRKTHEK